MFSSKNSFLSSKINGEFLCVAGGAGGGGVGLNNGAIGGGGGAGGYRAFPFSFNFGCVGLIKNESPLFGLALL
jgi:hypothetical protein